MLPWVRVVESMEDVTSIETLTVPELQREVAGVEAVLDKKSKLDPLEHLHSYMGTETTIVDPNQSASTSVDELEFP